MSDEQQQPQSASYQIQIAAQYIKDLSFENPHAPQSLQPQQEQPRIDVNVDVNASKLGEGPAYEVILKVTANAVSGDMPMFACELSFAGVFTFGDMPEEHLHPVLLIECPRLLFPFARQIMADATRDGGFPPLMIQPVDFAAMYRQTIERSQQQTQQ